MFTKNKNSSDSLVKAMYETILSNQRELAFTLKTTGDLNQRISVLEKEIAELTINAQLTNEFSGEVVRRIQEHTDAINKISHL
ncbi:MAG: hypothetical protein WC375_10955 [Methanomassiliicoccales archaeon]|jgi:uncharacterized small protein (DUF1192 family)